MMLSERRGWKTSDYALLVLLVVFAAWYSKDAWLDIINRALVDPENGHALFAPVVAFYLFWLRRSRLQFIRYRPSFV